MKSLEEKVWESLSKVIDPELGVDIVSLGLVYEVRAEAGEVEVEMTLTSAGCPMAEVIEKKVKSEVRKIEGVRMVTIELVWEPVWTPQMMDEETRAEMGIE